MSKAAKNTAGPTPPRSPVSQTASPSRSALVAPTSSITGTLSGTSTKPSAPSPAPSVAAVPIYASPTWPGSAAGPLPQILVKARPATPISNCPNGSSYSMSVSGYRTDLYGNRIWSDAATGQPTGKITPHNGGRRVTFPQCFPLLQVSAPAASQSSSLQDATADLPKGRTIGSFQCLQQLKPHSECLQQLKPHPGGREATGPHFRAAEAVLHRLQPPRPPVLIQSRSHPREARSYVQIHRRTHR